jgi:hypothetical protein
MTRNLWLKSRTTFVHGDERTVAKLPFCDFTHKVKMPARYDARTVKGPWRWMCAEHMKQHGVGVGLNKGQRLWLPKERHCPGEVPILELPVLEASTAAKCGGCLREWFEHAMGHHGFVQYCPDCVRKLPDRENGPFTFGDILSISYPAGLDCAGAYLARMDIFPCVGALRVRILHDDCGTVEDIQLFMDGVGGWWDVDNQYAGLLVRLAYPKEAAEYLRRARARDELLCRGRKSYLA